MAPDNDNILERFVFHLENARAKLAVAMLAIDGFLGVSPDNVHWGDVGDVARISELLDEVLEVVNTRKGR